MPVLSRLPIEQGICRMCKTTIVRFRCGHTVPAGRTQCATHLTAVSRYAVSADASCWIGSEVVLVDDQSNSCLFCRMDMLSIGDVGATHSTATADKPKGILKKPTPSRQMGQGAYWWDHSQPKPEFWEVADSLDRQADHPAVRRPKKKVHFATDLSSGRNGAV